jgi:hypothetical protein
VDGAPYESNTFIYLFIYLLLLDTFLWHANYGLNWFIFHKKWIFLIYNCLCFYKFSFFPALLLKHIYFFCYVLGWQNKDCCVKAKRSWESKALGTHNLLFSC